MAAAVSSERSVEEVGAATTVARRSGRYWITVGLLRNDG
jgi:hypothetical protein